MNLNFSSHICKLKDLQMNSRYKCMLAHPALKKTRSKKQLRR